MFTALQCLPYLFWGLKKGTWTMNGACNKKKHYYPSIFIKITIIIVIFHYSWPYLLIFFKKNNPTIQTVLNAILHFYPPKRILLMLSYPSLKCIFRILRIEISLPHYLCELFPQLEHPSAQNFPATKAISPE